MWLRMRMPWGHRRARAASTHFVKVWGESTWPKERTFAPKRKPQELPVMGKDGDVKICVF